MVGCCAGFLDRVRIELRLQGQLQGLGLKPGLVQQLLKQRATSNAEVNELRMDLSPMKQVGRVHGNHDSSTSCMLSPVLICCLVTSPFWQP
jgi:hypothetical protein